LALEKWFLKTYFLYYVSLKFEFAPSWGNMAM